MIKKLGFLALSMSMLIGMTPHEIRAHINNKVGELSGKDLHVEHVEDTTIAGVPVRIYGNGGKTVLFLHGGAWVAGNIDTHDEICRYFHIHSGLRIVSVEYTCAPEAVYPAQLEESYAVLEALGDGTIVMGDSAGGNMSAALCLMARDRKGPKIALQVLINPATDLSEDSNYFFAKHYAKDEQMKEGYVSPLFAKDLSNLPPAFIILAELDKLLVQGRAYAKRLEEAGVSVETFTQKGIGHLARNFARAQDDAMPSIHAALDKLKGII